MGHCASVPAQSGFESRPSGSRALYVKSRPRSARRRSWHRNRNRSTESTRGRRGSPLWTGPQGQHRRGTVKCVGFNASPHYPSGPAAENQLSPCVTPDKVSPNSSFPHCQQASQSESSDPRQGEQAAVLDAAPSFPPLNSDAVQQLQYGTSSLHAVISPVIAPALSTPDKDSPSYASLPASITRQWHLRTSVMAPSLASFTSFPSSLHCRAGASTTVQVAQLVPLQQVQFMSPSVQQRRKKR